MGSTGARRALGELTGEEKDPATIPGVTTDPSVSVIVPAYRAQACLARCVESLCSQEIGGTFEIIVVVSGDPDDDLGYAEAISPDPRLDIIVHRPRLSAAAGRNLGIGTARGATLVFTDADVVAEPGWLSALVGATEARFCVAGAVVNGTPRSRAGTTEYLVEFLDLHPDRPPETIWHGATCNLAVPRVLWERYGPFFNSSSGRIGVSSEDTTFTLRAAADGCLVFCGAARIRHMNRTRLRTVLEHQFALGRSNANLARDNPTYPYRGIVCRRWAAPLVVGARWLSLWRRLLSWRIGLSPRALGLSLHVGLALGAWGYGLFKENRLLDELQS